MFIQLILSGANEWYSFEMCIRFLSTELHIRPSVSCLLLDRNFITLSFHPTSLLVVKSRISAANNGIVRWFTPLYSTRQYTALSTQHPARCPGPVSGVSLDAKYCSQVPLSPDCPATTRDCQGGRRRLPPFYHLPAASLDGFYELLELVE